MYPPVWGVYRGRLWARRMRFWRRAGMCGGCRDGPLPGSLLWVQGVWGHYGIEASWYQVWGFRLVYGEILARGAAEVDKVGHVASGAHYINGCGHV